MVDLFEAEHLSRDEVQNGYRHRLRQLEQARLAAHFNLVAASALMAQTKRAAPEAEEQMSQAKRELRQLPEVIAATQKDFTAWQTANPPEGEDAPVSDPD